MYDTDTFDIARQSEQGSILSLSINALADQLEIAMIKGFGLELFRYLHAEFEREVDDRLTLVLTTLLTAQEIPVRGLALIWLRGTCIGSLTLRTLLALIACCRTHAQGEEEAGAYLMACEKPGRY